MKKIYALGAVAMALLTTGCSNDLTNNDSGIDNTGKERILFSAGDDGQSSVVTRAGFTDQTRIVARIVSDKRGGGAVDAKCVKTVLLADAEYIDNLTNMHYSKVGYASTTDTRYWDDAYGRSSILSVYAVAIPNKNTKTVNGTATPFIADSKLAGSTSWATGGDASNNNIAWSVTASQTPDILAEEDLTYSNNIQQSGDKGVWTWDYDAGKYPDVLENASNASKHSYGTDPVVNDGRLYFTQNGKAINDALTEDPGHFDRGHMDFKHSLTRIQVNLLKGEGYGTAPISVTAMQLLGQKVSGTFDIKTATWTPSDATTPVNMAVVNANAKYEAQVLPGYIFADNTINVLQLTVDGNTYYITNRMLRTALSGKDGVNDEFSTDMGVRYIFDVTVKKTKIENITATIVPWNEVNAEEFEIDNSHLTFSFYKNGTACTDVKLYKFEQTLDKVYTDDSYSADPAAGSKYTEVEGFEEVDETKIFTTSEYYKDNKTAYHFRSTNAATALLEGDKTFEMTSGAATDANDYHWGAPMNTSVSTATLPYSLDNGYLSSIAKGIVAAKQESQINLTEVHMMSQLVIKLTTPDVGGVTLDGATVTLTKLSKTGTVDMGSGKITPAIGTGIVDLDAVTVAKEGETNVYSCTINVVPQALVRNNGYVGITIKTTDNNEYYVIEKLSEIIATSTGSEVTNMQQAGEGHYITRWYPGHKYTYRFNITKKQIDVITATIVPWNTVTAADTELDLEK